jgi:hypothetical protein
MGRRRRGRGRPARREYVRRRSGQWRWSSLPVCSRRFHVGAGRVGQEGRTEKWVNKNRRKKKEKETYADDTSVLHIQLDLGVVLKVGDG